MLPLCQATSGSRCLQPRGTKRSPTILQTVPKRTLARLPVCSLWQQPASPGSEGAGGASKPSWWPHLSQLRSCPAHVNTNVSRSASCQTCVRPTQSIPAMRCGVTRVRQYLQAEDGRSVNQFRLSGLDCPRALREAQREGASAV